MNRKQFLSLTGLTAGSVIVHQALGHEITDAVEERVGARTFGIQLWTLRDDMPADPKGVLKQVAAMGYKQIESFEGKTGIYWGMSNIDFKKYVNDLGMKLVSAHCDITKDFEKKADEAAAIGIRYLVCPWKGPQKSIDDFKKFAAECNAKGAICKKAGIRFAYHNHDYTFDTLDGQIPQEILMKETDPALVDFEMDMYWVVTAGADPIAWLKKYPGRFRLCHIKDRIKNATDKNASCTLGTGSIDYPAILKTARKNGMKYFIVEQEKYDNTTPLAAVADDAAYMKKIRF
jgi:sugar phosphate isomerase/epimerase